MQMPSISNSGSHVLPQQDVEHQTQIPQQAATADPFRAGISPQDGTTGDQSLEPRTQPHSGNEQPITPTTSHELIRQDARYFIAPNTQGN